MRARLWFEPIACAEGAHTVYMCTYCVVHSSASIVVSIITIPASTRIPQIVAGHHVCSSARLGPLPTQCHLSTPMHLAPESFVKSKPCDRDSQAISTWGSCKRHAASHGNGSISRHHVVHPPRWPVHGCCCLEGVEHDSSDHGADARAVSWGNESYRLLFARRHRPLLPPPCCTAFCAPWPPRMKM
jgi:hypothetical protein